jgi:hypothetical protein
MLTQLGGRHLPFAPRTAHYRRSARSGVWRLPSAIPPRGLRNEHIVRQSCRYDGRICFSMTVGAVVDEVLLLHVFKNKPQRSICQ